VIAPYFGGIYGKNRQRAVQPWEKFTALKVLEVASFRIIGSPQATA
jgi:hypothetical protein